MSRRPAFATATRSSSLYQDPRWKARRAAQLQAEPYCRMCRAEGKLTPATFADHIEPHRGDDRAFFANPLQSLCRWHSNVKTGRETRARMSTKRPVEPHPGLVRS